MKELENCTWEGQRRTDLVCLVNFWSELFMASVVEMLVDLQHNLQRFISNSAICINNSKFKTQDTNNLKINKK
jgi:hypothetical protein